MSKVIKGLVGVVCGGVVAVSMVAAFGSAGVALGSLAGAGIVWMWLDS